MVNSATKCALLRACREEKYGQIVLPQIAVGLDGQVSEELCASAASMANNLNAAAIFVYTRRGYMASFLSRCRPDCPIFAFTGAVGWICRLRRTYSDAELVMASSVRPGPQQGDGTVQHPSQPT